MNEGKRIHIAFSLAMTLLVATTCGSARADQHWVATWGAAPSRAGRSFNHETVRQIVRVSAGGSSVRIRLTNLNGDGAITLGPVHIALHANASNIQPGSDRALTFHGSATVTIAQGDSVLSDPVAMNLQPLQELAITFYAPSTTGPSTAHATGLNVAYVSEGEDTTSATQLPDPQVLPIMARFFVSNVEVAGSSAANAVVAFGDSITDGFHSTPDLNHRWPDFLAARLQASNGKQSVDVVNSGIAGNRILTDGAGPSALSRFDRDALDQAGAHWIVLLEGINDVGDADQPKTPKDDVSAQQVIDGMKTLIARAHAKGLKIYGGTLLPFAGARAPYYSSVSEQKRQIINTWIRHSGAFDAVIDFDLAMRDPAHPLHLLPAFDSGDHLHPNDAGYKEMADSVDLNLFDE